MEKSMMKLNTSKSKIAKLSLFQIWTYVHLDDWVAIAGACDGIISVSTALVHFALQSVKRLQ